MTHLVACTQCAEPFERSPEFFAVDKRRSDGLGSWCRACRRAKCAEFTRGYRSRMAPGELRAQDRRRVESYADLEPPAEKRCPACAETKAVGEFGVDRKRKDRLTAYCRPCTAAKSHASYMRHREARLEQSKAYRSGVRPARQARAREYYKENKAEIDAKHREYYRDDANRDAFRDRVARRRVRQAGAPAEKIDRVGVYDRDGGRCHICGRRCRRDSWHMDHIVPVAAGGAHVYENVAVSCPT